MHKFKKGLPLAAPFLLRYLYDMTTLITDRLILRGPKPTDLEDLFTIFSNPDAMAHWSTAPHAHRDVTQERLDKMTTDFATDPTYFIFERAGRAIGMGGMFSEGEIGFILHPDHWRQGLGFEAISAVITHVWASTALMRLHAGLDPQNAGSKALLRRLGFTENGFKEKTHFINGVWSDSIYMTLSRPESLQN